MSRRMKRMGVFVVAAGLLAVAIAGLPSMAGAAGDAAAPSSEEAVVPPYMRTPAAGQQMESLTLGEIIRISGWCVYILITLSLAALSFVIYFFLTLRQAKVVPVDLRRELTTKIRSGSLQGVEDVCRSRPCPLSSLVLSAVEHLRIAPDSDLALLKDVMEGEGGRQAEMIQGQIRYLMDIASVAPLVGFLGTVLGMVKAFRGVAVNEVLAQPIVLANGVQMALYTTVEGLFIAIPTMLFYSYFRERAAMLVSQLEAASAEVLAHFLRARPK